MQITTQNYSALPQQSIAFKSSLPLGAKKAVNRKVLLYLDKKGLEPRARILNPAMFLTTATQFAASLFQKDLGSATFSGGMFFFFRGLCIKQHKRALNAAMEMAKEFKSKGMNHDARLQAVKKCLTEIGCPIFSQLFKVFNRSELKTLADGVPVKYPANFL